MSPPVELKAIEVFGGGATALVSYRELQLEKAVIPVEELSSAESPSGFAGARSLSEGHAAMIFIDLSLKPGARPPKELHHRFSFSVTRKNGEIIERTVDGVVVGVVQEPAPVLSAPLRGSAWRYFAVQSTGETHGPPARISTQQRSRDVPLTAGALQPFYELLSVNAA